VGDKGRSAVVKHDKWIHIAAVWGTDEYRSLAAVFTPVDADPPEAETEEHESNDETREKEKHQA